MSYPHPFAEVSLAVSLLWGCAQAPAPRDAPPDAILRVPLAAAPHNAARIGQATLIPQGEATRVVLHVSGVPQHTTRPVHLYGYIREGTCSTTEARRTYSLTRKVLAHPAARSGSIPAAGPLQLTTSAAVSLTTLRAQPHALEVRAAPADGGERIFCGEIAPTPS